jgi:4-hydroxy-3-polyprenylbenzoate decarboxylase
MSNNQYNGIMDKTKRIILAITGASGAVYRLRSLEALKDLNIEVHLVVSPVRARILRDETEFSVEEIRNKAEHSYQPDDLNAPIASGSYPTDGMMIVPCSIKTLSGVANCYGENLIQRAADVCLKEGRPLLLAMRETPLHAGHLRLMNTAAEAGAIIFPLAPAFYHHPQTINDLVNAAVGRMLARIGIANDLYQPWE